MALVWIPTGPSASIVIALHKADTSSISLISLAPVGRPLDILNIMCANTSQLEGAIAFGRFRLVRQAWAHSCG
jgi:hypothetical protein